TSDNDAAATASGSTLTFNTTNVTVNPGGFTGPFEIYGLTNWGHGAPVTATVVPGLTYEVALYSSAFGFSVDGSGNVTSDNAAAATGSGSTLTFNTTNVTVNPGGYTRPFEIYGVTDWFQGAPLTATVVPGLTYEVALSGPGFLFSVDGSGNVTSDNAAAATGSGSTLTFNTTNVTINPGGYTGLFAFDDVTGWIQGGPVTATAVLGLTYNA